MQLTTRLLAPLLLAVLAAVPVAPTGPGPAQEPGPADDPTEALAVESVTVFALRHAEKGDDDPRDPGLTEAGTARARDLARLLAAADVTHLFSSDYRRTRDTLAPLAEATGLEVALYDPRTPARLLETLSDLPPGSRAVVSGHSNTTPALVRALGGELDDLEKLQGMDVLGHDQYDRLFVLTLGDREHATTTVELRYGAGPVD